MKYRLLITLIYLLFFSNFTLAVELNCNQFEKLSAKYIECNAKKLKNDTNNKVVEGKKKFNNSLLKEKLIKFKNSENLMDFLKEK